MPSKPKVSFEPVWLLAPSLLAMAWLVSKAQWFWNNRPDLQFGWVVVLLCAYLFYEALEKQPPLSVRPRWWSILAFAAGAAGLFLVQIYQVAFGTNAASMCGLAAMIMLVAFANLGLVFGRKGITAFGLAYAFILIAMPMPGFIHGPIVNGLQNKVAVFNTEILNLLGIPAQRVGSLIHLPGGTVGIDEACSGIRSLQSTIMATLFIGYLTLKRVSFQILLLIAGIGLAIFGNLVRSLYLSLTANSQGVEAINRVHDAAGWTILIFTTVGVIILSWLFNKLDQAATTATATEPGVAAAPGTTPAP